MPNDFLSRAHAHMFIIVPLNEGACFFCMLTVCFTCSVICVTDFMFNML